MSDDVRAAADDDEPVTAEWLESVGWGPAGSYQERQLGDKRFSIDNAAGCFWLHAESIMAGTSVYRMRLPHIKTCGHVRALCAALGIELEAVE